MLVTIETTNDRQVDRLADAIRSHAHDPATCPHPSDRVCMRETTRQALEVDAVDDLERVQASDGGDRLTLTGAAVTASMTRRMIGGELVRYGVVGRTSRGPLRVRAGALRFPPNLSAVKLTREHELTAVRGHLTEVRDLDGRLRIAARVSDGPDGDAALQEARDHTRDYLSYDVVDATIEGDELTDGLVIAVAQTGIPAYADSRIDSVAASAATGTSPAAGATRGRHTMTEEQRRRLGELRALQTLTDEQRAELDSLAALEGDEQQQQPDAQQQQPAPAAAAPAAAPAGGQQVAASLQPAIPGGVPGRSAATTQPRAGDTLDAFVRSIVEGYRANSPARITAALADVTYTANSGVMAPGWSGELWSGVAYEPVFTPLLSSGDLTSIKGTGWRWVTKPVMADYAGDKAAVPSNALSTEDSEYAAARMAVGHDIDRVFYDFPTEQFLRSYVEAARESWAVKLDGKVEAYIVAQAVAATIGGVAVPSQPSLLKAVRKGMLALKRNLVGKGTFVVVSDDDFDTLLDLTNDDLPAFMALLGISPESFTSSAAVADGTVLVGAKQAATVRTLPGSPIRATAQHLANGGIDEAFFGYYAIEEHHTSGIVEVPWAVVP